MGNPALIKNLGFEATINGTMMLVRLNKNEINPNYFYQVLNSDYFFKLLHLLKSGSSIPHIFQRDMINFKFPICSLEEQKKISMFLEKIDKKIELLEKKLGLYQKFNEGLKEQMFGNISSKNYIKLKTFLKESKIPYEDDINKRLTVKLNLKGITKREVKSIEKEGATTQYLRKEGQFIYGKQNLHKGAFGIVPKELDGYLSSSDIPSFDFIDEKINPVWFYYYFSRKSFYEKLERLSTGTGSKRISPKEFLNIKIPFLSLEQQNKDTILLNELKIKEGLINNELNNLKEFKLGLLQKMFV